MKKLIELTALKMNPPEPYGIFHVSFFIIGLIFCFYFARRLKNISDKQNKRLLFFTGLFLLVIEVYKELFYFYIVNKGHYDFSIFPFQLCDVPTYMCLLIPFIKNKKVEESIYNFMVSYNLLGGFIAFLEPSSLCRPYLMMTLHGFLWHIILIFIGIYLYYSKRCLRVKKDFTTSVKVYLVLCTIALSLNFILRKVSLGKLNAFYLGPNVSPVVIFSDISLKFGWIANMIIFISVMTLGAYLVYLFLYYLEDVKLYIKQKVNREIENES